MKRKLAMTSLGFLIFIVIISFLAPYITTEDIYRIDMANINQEPSKEHWFGTDRNGRDVFVRMLYGGRVSLMIGLFSMFFVTLIGSIIGSFSVFLARNGV